MYEGSLSLRTTCAPLVSLSNAAASRGRVTADSLFKRKFKVTRHDTAGATVHVIHIAAFVFATSFHPARCVLSEPDSEGRGVLAALAGEREAFTLS